MSPDPTAMQLAQLTGRRYEEARMALRWMEWNGYPTLDAANALLSEWTLGKTLTDLARSLAVSPADTTEAG